MMTADERYVQSVRRAVESMTRRWDRRGEGSGFDKLWETHNEAAEEVARITCPDFRIDKIPSLVREYYGKLASIVRHDMVTKKMNCAEARALVAARTLLRGVNAKNMAMCQACRGAAALLVEAGDAWVAAEATMLSGGQIGGEALWAKHVTTAQVVTRAALENVTNRREIPTLFGGFFADFMATVRIRRKAERLPGGVARKRVVTELLAGNIPNDPVRAAAFTTAALLVSAIPDGEAPSEGRNHNAASHNTPSATAGIPPSSRAEAESLPATLAVGVTEMKNNSGTPTLGMPPAPPIALTSTMGTRLAASATTDGNGRNLKKKRGEQPDPPMTSPDPAVATPFPPAGRKNARTANTPACPTATMLMPTDITSRSPWAKQPHGCPGATGALSCAPKSTNTDGAEDVNGLRTTASPMPPLVEKAAGAAGAMARPTSSDLLGGTVAAESFAASDNVGMKRTTRFESGVAVRVEGTMPAAEVQAARAEGVGKCLSGEEQHGSSPDQRRLDTVGGCSSGSYDDMQGGASSTTPGAAPAPAAGAGGDWDSVLATISSSCDQPQGFGASKDASAPGLLPPAPSTASMATEAATGAAAAKYLEFFSCFQENEDAYEPRGNNSASYRVEPNMPVAPDANEVAAAAASVAAATAEAVAAATAEAIAAAAVTSSPEVTEAGVEGARATVAAFPAPVNPSEAFITFKPPIPFDFETTENCSGSDITTGNGVNGPTDDGGDGGGSTDGRKRKVAGGGENEMENRPCDGGGVRKKIRSG